MSRKQAVLFRPSYGCNYYVENTKDKHQIIGKVLGPNDKKVFGEIKSDRNCKKGEEFFKMLIDGRLYTMMNGIIKKECLSKEGPWKFTGVKATKQKVPRLKKQRVIKQKAKQEQTKNKIEFVSEIALKNLLKKGNS